MWGQSRRDIPVRSAARNSIDPQFGSDTVQVDVRPNLLDWWITELKLDLGEYPFTSTLTSVSLVWYKLNAFSQFGQIFNYTASSQREVSQVNLSGVAVLLQT